MTIKGMPFDAKKNADGTYDRVVYSQDIADYFGYLSSNGILLKKDQALTDQLKVTYDGITTTVNTGVAMVEGRRAEVTEAETLRHEYGGTLPRYDLIVLELNLLTTERCFKLKIIKGEGSNSPSAPSVSVLTRTSTIYQLGLAYVKINAGSTSIASITDVRDKPDFCGLSYVNVPDEAKILSLIQPSVLFDNTKDGKFNLDTSYEPDMYLFGGSKSSKDYSLIYDAKRCDVTIEYGGGLSSELTIPCTLDVKGENVLTSYTYKYAKFSGSKKVSTFGAKAIKVFNLQISLEDKSISSSVPYLEAFLDAYDITWSSDAVSGLSVARISNTTIPITKIEIYYY